MVRIHCLGGCKEVGRNAFLIDASKNIMLDYGVKVETAEAPLAPKLKVDALFITHGHLDHLGLAPALVRNHNLPVFGTEVTRDLTELLLKDSLKITDLKGLKRNYSAQDIKKVLAKWKVIRYNQTITIGNVKITALDASHIPGSCIFLVEEKDKKILYTGDFKLAPMLLTGGARLNVEDIDVAIMETTYSSREHPDRNAVEKELYRLVKNTLGQGGVALIPSFAIRAPEILLSLYKLGADFPIYLDGMARAATEIVLRHPRYVENSELLRKAVRHAEFIHNNEERIAAIKKPCAIITTGGCLDGGPIAEYLKRLYTRVDCSLILTGFQIPRTAGRYLVDTGRYVVDGMDMKLKMPFYQLDFSAHAGRKDLLDFVKKVRPKKVICVHGEYCEKFATEIKSRFAIKATAPEAGEVVTL